MNIDLLKKNKLNLRFITLVVVSFSIFLYLFYFVLNMGIVLAQEIQEECTPYSYDAYDFCLKEYNEADAIDAIKKNEFYIYLYRHAYRLMTPKKLCKEFNNCELIGTESRTIDGVFITDGPMLGVGLVDSREIATEDLCTNIENIQLVMPAGFKEVAPGICQADPGFNVYCRTLTNPVLPNASTTFSAMSFNNAPGPVYYEWFDQVRTFTMGSETTEGSPTLSYKFPTVGIFRVIVNARDSNGTWSHGNCGVTVADIPEEEEIEIIETVEEVVETTTEEETIELGPEISLTGGGVTNDFCTLEWQARDVERCFLTQAKDGTIIPVDIVGSGSVLPGMYLFGCIKNEVTRESIYSERAVCTKNFNIRDI